MAAFPELGRVRQAEALRGPDEPGLRVAIEEETRGLSTKQIPPAANVKHVIVMR